MAGDEYFRRKTIEVAKRREPSGQQRVDMPDRTACAVPLLLNRALASGDHLVEVQQHFGDAEPDGEFRPVEFRPRRPV